jgi:hypothetical protein
VRTATFIALWLSLVSATAAAQSAPKAPLTLPQYIAALERLHASIANGQLSTARTEALDLNGSEVAWAEGRFVVDSSLLIRIAQTTRSDRALLTRIELTINELRSGGGSVAQPNARLLKEVAAEQEVPELASGGEITTPVVPDTPITQRIARTIADALEWVAEKFVQLVKWLLKFLPRSGGGKKATTGMRWIVIAVVTMIVLLILYLAFAVARRARRNADTTVASSVPMRSSRDDDPLSRGATEWERYAEQLAADGRFREAIRAWYHAVLVTSYAAGVLHFRKGRTNWEYIAALSPSLAWRADFIRLTRNFEHEWYGREQSSEEMLEACRESARSVLEALHRSGVERRGAA